LNSQNKIPSGALTLKGADTNNKVRAGDKNVLLATLKIRGKTAGTTLITVTVLGMKDDSGMTYRVPGMNGKLVVLSPPAVPENEAVDAQNGVTIPDRPGSSESPG